MQLCTAILIIKITPSEVGLFTTAAAWDAAISHRHG